MGFRNCNARVRPDLRIDSICNLIVSLTTFSVLCWIVALTWNSEVRLQLSLAVQALRANIVFETPSVGQSAVALLAVGWKARDHESHQ